MKWDEKFETRMLNIALKAHGINPMGKHFLLAPSGDDVALVCGEICTVIANYSLEDGETIEELRDCLKPLLEGGYVMAPTVV